MSDNNNPVTREEMYLSAAAGNDTELPEPITRKELFLAKAAGADVQTPEPITREEMFLSRITGGGSGGGGGGSVRLQNKTFNANGTYKADAGYDGFGTVTVDVAGSGGSDEDWIIGDGNTHLWISLPEGRTSPMLGVCPNGTVTVDWGDGSTPDILTGTNAYAVQWTPNHEYAAAGDYVITLTVDGEMGFSGDVSTNANGYVLRHSSSSDIRNAAYRHALQKIEIGSGVTSIGSYSFSSCHYLMSVVIPDSVTYIASGAFSNCYYLTNINLPNNITSIGEGTFSGCRNLSNIVIPDGVSSIAGSAFYDCSSLDSIIIPNSVTSMGTAIFYRCSSLTSTALPEGSTNISDQMFHKCFNLTNIIIPKSVMSIGAGAFQDCYCMRVYDFSNHTAVPTLTDTSAFKKISADCEIRVPAALVDEWKAATNWSTYADYIVGV